MILSQILTGRVILLIKDKAILSPVIQGEMYPKANGEELISYLSQIYSEKHFRKYVTRFINRNYRFRKADEEFDVLKVDSLKNKGLIDFKRISYETVFNAHWLYIKNLMQTEIEFKFRDGPTVVLKRYETLATCTGKSITYPLHKILKEKNTLRPIVLIEKIN